MKKLVASIWSYFKRKMQWNWYLVCGGLLCCICFPAYVLWVTPSSYNSNYSQTAFDINRMSTAPQLIHMVSISTGPLRCDGLATIDSIARHMPNLTINVHVTQEEDIPTKILSQRVAVLNAQLEAFRSKGVKVNLVLHDNIKADIAGTPLEGLPLQQRHVAGLWDVEPFAYFVLYASDLMRLLVLFKHGGIYCDGNYLVIADMMPLFNYYGPNIVSRSYYTGLDNDCVFFELNNAWFALEARHPFIAAVLDTGVNLINKDGADRAFPWRKSDFDSSRTPSLFMAIGSIGVTAAHRAMCKGPPPVLIVNEIPSFLKPGNVQGVKASEFSQSTYTGKYGNNAITTPYVLMSEKILAPFTADEVNWLADLDPSTLEFVKKWHTVAQFIKRIDDSFQVHIFGEAKFRWLELLESGSRYPLVQYMHAKSCKHLCDLKEFKRVNDLWATVEAS